MAGFEKERKSRAHYEKRARLYDWANHIATVLRGTTGIRERRKAVRRLELKPGHSVLEVSVGTGTNLALIHEAVTANGKIVGLDISGHMLDRCREKLSRGRIGASLVTGEAGHLPFTSDRFDAVFHHGGIAEFGDRKAAIDEMWRVTKPRGRLVICDAGRPTDRRLSMANQFLMRFQPEYDLPPPMNLLPSEAQEVKLSWFHRGGWYLIEFRKPEAAS